MGEYYTINLLVTTMSTSPESQHDLEIATLRQKLASNASELRWLERRDHSVDEWNHRVDHAEKTNAAKKQTLAAEEAKCSESKGRTTLMQAVVEEAADLAELLQELEFLEQRALTVKAEIAEKIQAIGEADFDISEATKIKATASGVVENLKKEWEVPTSESGRLSFALCSPEMRRRYWDLDLMRSRSGIRDPYHIKNQYNDRDFRQRVRHWGWEM